MILTLVMLIPVLPAAVFADTSEPLPELVEKEINLADLTMIATGFVVDVGSNSATAEGKMQMERALNSDLRIC